MSVIDSKYQSLGGQEGFLGKPTSGETSCPDGVGRYRHYEHGSIYWHPYTGAHEIHGLIRAKWASLGWEKSFLGYPKTDESPSPIGGGKYSQFQGGTILWFPPSKEAFEVHGAIRSKWGSLGWESGFLGFPITDETKTPDGIGRFNHFQHGSVYWKPSISAHEVHGLIKKYWADNGWEKNSDLGYPISDELSTEAEGKNRCNDFENGVVYWKYGEKKASALSKVTFGGASQTAAQVLAKISAIIKPKLEAQERVYIKGGPSLVLVEDYYYDGKVHNRRYKIHTSLGIDISAVPDPTSNLDIWIEIEYHKPSREVRAFVQWWHLHTHVPWPTSMAVSASEINDKFKPVLNAAMGERHTVGKAPEGINILSTKVMPNGDLNIYMEPVCVLSEACFRAKGLPDDCEELELLRRFRDEWLAEREDGERIIGEYYWLAPQIVQKINASADSSTIYEDLYNRLVVESVRLIRDNQEEKAFSNYFKIFEELKKKYLPLHS